MIFLYVLLAVLVSMTDPINAVGGFLSGALWRANRGAGVAALICSLALVGTLGIISAHLYQDAIQLTRLIPRWSAVSLWALIGWAITGVIVRRRRVVPDPEP